MNSCYCADKGCARVRRYQVATGTPLVDVAAAALLQEEALMQVPQELLSLVNGGTAEDFKVILENMQSANASALTAFSEKMDFSTRVDQ